MELLWKIYYDDGSIYSNLDGEFVDAPSDGVLGVVEIEEEVGYQIFRGKDFYFELEDGTMGTTDELGPLLRKLGIIKFGRWCGKAQWAKVWGDMVKDAKVDFPRKTGRTVLETTLDG